MEIYMNIMSLTAVELGKRIKAKEISVEEAVTAALDAIEKKEKLVNSFVPAQQLTLRCCGQGGAQAFFQC